MAENDAEDNRRLSCIRDTPHRINAAKTVVGERALTPAAKLPSEPFASLRLCVSLSHYFHLVRLVPAGAKADTSAVLSWARALWQSGIFGMTVSRERRVGVAAPILRIATGARQDS
jgi:hypothetical protein